jgi:uncharacterized protein (TIGR00369 family)
MSDPAARATTGSQPATPATGGNGRGKANVEAADETVQEAVLRYEDFRIRPHGCFACGELNEIGLHLKLHLTTGRCRTELEIPRRFEGWEGIIHGGILCTILDEVMAWALVASDNWGVTARMSVEFKKPVTVGQVIRAEGWITESRRRVQSTAGRIVDAESGAELATAEGTYVAASDTRKRELKELYGVAERERQAGPDRPEEAAQEAAR